MLRIFIFTMLVSCSSEDGHETGSATTSTTGTTSATGTTGTTDCVPSAAMSLSKSELAANGIDSVSVQVEGICLLNPVLVSSAGSLSTLVESRPGTYTATLVSSNIPGDAVLVFTADDLKPVTETIVMEIGQPVSVNFHLHGPISEGELRHGYATEQAIETDVSVLWWTDHDYRYDFDLFKFIDEPDFVTSGVVLAEDDQPFGFDTPDFFELSPGKKTNINVSVDEKNLFKGDRTLAVNVMRAGNTPGNDLAKMTWSADMERLYRPLLSGVTLKFAIQMPDNWDPTLSRVRVVAKFSNVNMSNERRLVFHGVGDVVTAGPYDVLYPMTFTANGWTEVDLDLTDFAVHNFDEGIDTTFQELSFEFETAADSLFQYNIGGLSIREEICCDELMEVQREYLDANLSKEVQHFVGQEISYKGSLREHFLAYGADVKLANYDIYSLLGNMKELLADFKSRGALLSFAHPLVGTEDIEAFCADLAKENVFGMDLIEVTNLQKVPFEDYMELWDCLSEKQFILTGIAGSDEHYTRPWTAMPYLSPFVTYPLVFGDTEEDYLQTVKRGNVFMANHRVLIGKQFSMRVFAADRLGDMGQIVDNLSKEPLELKIAVQGNQKGDEIRWLVNGVVVKEEKTVADEYSLVITPEEWTWVRAELWRNDVVVDQPIILTNPIYLSTADIDVPEEREPRQ